MYIKDINDNGYIKHTNRDLPLEVFVIRTIASGVWLLQFVTVEIPLLRVEKKMVSPTIRMKQKLDCYTYR